jgi:thiamine biosynthesis lipoprotein
MNLKKTTLSIFSLVVLVGVIFLLLLSSRGRLQQHEISVLKLGTLVSIVFYSEGNIGIKTVEDACLKKIDELEQIFSVHRADSELSRLNAAAASEPFKPSSELLDVIRRSKELSERTGGAFDPTVFPLIRMWKLSDFGDAPEQSVPDDAEIKALLPLLGMDKVNIDAGTVRFANDRIRLDLGGIAKRYIVDQVAALLESMPGIAAGIVNIGGDLSAFQNKPGMRPFRIGIRDPLKKDAMLGYVEIASGSVVTSGGYERYREFRRKKYIHIIDPATGYPLDNGVLSVTVIGRTALDCSSLAYMVLGPERARSLGVKEKILFVVDKGGKTDRIFMNGFELR